VTGKHDGKEDEEKDDLEIASLCATGRFEKGKEKERFDGSSSQTSLEDQEEEKVRGGNARVEGRPNIMNDA